MRKTFWAKIKEAFVNQEEIQKEAQRIKENQIIELLRVKDDLINTEEKAIAEEKELEKQRQDREIQEEQNRVPYIVKEEDYISRYGTKDYLSTAIDLSYRCDAIVDKSIPSIVFELSSQAEASLSYLFGNIYPSRSGMWTNYTGSPELKKIMCDNSIALTVEYYFQDCILSGIKIAELWGNHRDYLMKEGVDTAIRTRMDEIMRTIVSPDLSSIYSEVAAQIRYHLIIGKPSNHVLNQDELSLFYRESGKTMFEIGLICRFNGMGYIAHADTKMTSSELSNFLSITEEWNSCKQFIDSVIVEREYHEKSSCLKAFSLLNKLSFEFKGSDRTKDNSQHKDDAEIQQLQYSVTHTTNVPKTLKTVNLSLDVQSVWQLFLFSLLENNKIENLKKVVLSNNDIIEYHKPHDNSEGYYIPNEVWERIQQYGVRAKVEIQNEIATVHAFVLYGDYLEYKLEMMNVSFVIHGNTIKLIYYSEWPFVVKRNFEVAGIDFMY